MSNVIFGGQGIHSAGAKTNMGNLGNIQMSAGGQSLFNMDGSNNSSTQNNSNNQGGNSMGGLGMWNTTGSQGQQVTQNNATQNTVNGTGTMGGWHIDGQTNSNTATTFNQMNTNGQGASGVKWGATAQQMAQTNLANGNAQYDVVGAAKEAVKNLGSKLLQLVPSLNNEEFNEMVKLFDLVGAKEEFLQLSGRKDSYLDRQLLTEAINELNTTFMENNQKNAELTNTLNSIAQVLNNTGAYDAGNVYRFINNAISVGAIPAAIKNDPGRTNLVKVVNMAIAFKNNGGVSGVGASGVNWGLQQNQQNAMSWGATGNNMGMWNTSSTWGQQNNGYNYNSNPAAAWGLNNNQQQVGISDSWLQNSQWGQTTTNWGQQNTQMNTQQGGNTFDWGSMNMNTGVNNNNFNMNNNNVSLGDGTQYSTRKIVGGSGGTVGGNQMGGWPSGNNQQVGQGQQGGFNWADFGAQQGGQVFGGTQQTVGTPNFIR